jgi:glycosyltransferase involved in cell wall biosynthesis
MAERIIMLLENNPYPQDVRVRSEAESLAAAGHEVIVSAPRGPGQSRRERIRGVEVVRFRLPDGSKRGALGFVLEYFVAAVALHAAAIRELIRGATVLHLHNPPDIMFPAGAIFRAVGRKVIFDHHDLFPETVQVKFGYGVAPRVARACQRLTFAVASHVLATNRSYADVALEAGGKREDEVTIVRNAPPSAWSKLPRQQRRGVLDTVRLAYLGAVSGQDGVAGLAPVLAHLARGADSLSVSLTIVGDGDGRREVEREMRTHGVADLVSFTGWVAPDRVPELIQAADICVDPAPATDVNARSTMTKIAEYLSLGKPVVAYDLLETRRTAQDAACLVPPGRTDAFAQAIAELARNPDLRDAMIRRADERSRDLTWEQSERALLSAYAALRG